MSKIDPEKILKSIPIPPRPAVLIDLMAEFRKEDPDLRKMAKLISSDPSLFAALLKTVNSPLFNLRSKVSTVQEAINFLGMKNVMNMVSAIAIRNSVGNVPPSVERFWNNTEIVALIATHIASCLPGVPKDEAYTYALFHDCGIPILEQRVPGYSETVTVAATACDQSGQTFTEFENERHHTSHTSVGYLLTRNWGLPDELSEALRLHHDPSVFASKGVSAKALTLIAIGLIAEHIHHSHYLLKNDVEWEKMGEAALEYLGLSEIEFEEIKEGAERKLAG